MQEKSISQRLRSLSRYSRFFLKDAIFDFASLSCLTHTTPNSLALPSDTPALLTPVTTLQVSPPPPPKAISQSLSNSKSAPNVRTNNPFQPPPLPLRNPNQAHPSTNSHTINLRRRFKHPRKCLKRSNSRNKLETPHRKSRHHNLLR